ncbi:Transcriptional regulatory protein sin3 [Entomortierella beljakovae]|nr:Transcriptional regulatory protein sin3 [Entomortierella beljakovae]
MLSRDLSGQEDSNDSMSFAHSLTVAPMNTADALRNIGMVLENAHNQNNHDSDIVMMDSTNGNHSDQQQQPESRMALAELLVSLSHSNGNGQPDLTAVSSSIPEASAGESSQPSPMYKNAVDYVCSVKKAYESNNKVYADFLLALEKYHNMSLPIEQLVQKVMTLFQDQPELLMGFKEFLPESKSLLNQLVPNRTPKPTTQATSQPTIPSTTLAVSSAEHDNSGASGFAAADFLSLIKRFHKFMPTVIAGVEVTEPRIISKAPPQELVVSRDFIEAKDFVQTVKFEARNEMSMYDRFISALEKYQRTGWTIDQVYSEVSLIFWNHPDALAGFKKFITTVPQQP